LGVAIDTSVLRNRAEQTARANVRKYQDCQFMALYCNLIHAVAIICGQTKWDNAAKLLNDELSSVRETVRMNDVTSISHFAFLILFSAQDIVELLRRFCLRKSSKNFVTPTSFKVVRKYIKIVFRT